MMFIFRLIPLEKIWALSNSQLFFYKDDFGIKYSKKVDVLVNEETKPN